MLYTTLVNDKFRNELNKCRRSFQGENILRFSPGPVTFNKSGRGEQYAVFNGFQRTTDRVRLLESDFDDANQFTGDNKPRKAAIDETFIDADCVTAPECRGASLSHTAVMYPS